MSLVQEIHSKKTLAVKYNYEYRLFLRKLKALLLDKEISVRFGKYQYPFTPKQLAIIIEEWGEPPKV